MAKESTSDQLKALKSIEYWGASTSAHQVEGRNHNQWSVWELENANRLARTAPDKLAHWLPRWKDFEHEATQPDNYVSSVAVDFYKRYEEDFELLAKLNMNSFRFSIEWSRIEPAPGKWDHREIEHYRKMIKNLKKRGIEPMPCLMHFTEPVWFYEMGGFTKRKNINYFVRFCKKVMTELGDDVTYIYTINEANVHTGMTYFAGLWPGGRSFIKGTFHYWNMMVAHKRAYTELKNLKRKFQIGVAHHYIYSYPANSNPISSLMARLRNWSVNWLYINRTRPYHDFIGINYYQSDRVRGFKQNNPNQKQNDMGWDMQPYNIRHVLRRAYWKYHKPIIISENGLADNRDQDRQWWIQETMKALSDAIAEDKVKILGYTHWSLLDNFEWDSGFWPRFGLVEVERNTLTRKIRPSAEWFGKFIKKVRD